jgi:phage baseplate assembly protein gpV
MALSVKLSLPMATALLAASSLQVSQAQTVCNSGVCKATVAVQSCEGGGLTVDPDTIPVSQPNNIEWTISTAGYSFPSNGIVINGTGFTNPHVTGNGKKFMVHDDHTDMRPDIKYAVRVVRVSDGVNCAAFDPYIKNQ